ncbi:MAG: aminomethyl-transferring glycine dehydrogenase [Pseudomonadota bacterium]
MTHSLADLTNTQHADFIQRHIGPSQADTLRMLADMGVDSLDTLLNESIPAHIRKQDALAISASTSEAAALEHISAYAKLNVVSTSYIGMGYYPCHTPTVIQRNILENPGWYTAYTPYQPEISQGRLEALLNYQQMVIDLTGMELANASLLDEATAAAEAMTLCKRSNKKNKSRVFFVDHNCHPQTIAVVTTRAHHMDLSVHIADVSELNEVDYFAALLQYPGSNGDIIDLTAANQIIHDKQALSVVATDLLSLALLKSPGECGADIALGNSQRFGVPMGCGGPHAAFFATKNHFKRSIPGRIIGQSIDSKGSPALRMALQTREQHIRREKATSNICTAQALLAIMAGFYAVYHGPQGIKHIAQRTHQTCAVLNEGLTTLGYTRRNAHFFDTLSIDTGDLTTAVMNAAQERLITLRQISHGTIGISVNETTTPDDLSALLTVFAQAKQSDRVIDLDSLTLTTVHNDGIPTQQQRNSDILTHEVFSKYHSETELLRYMHALEQKDIALNHSMIALGSCTMKLNPTSAMLPISWPEFAHIHPFAPKAHLKGYDALCTDLESFLAACTGYDSVSLQPNAGSQGEYAGLLAIKRYHEHNQQGHRNVCLIPSSAHGTNPASAAMLNYKIVIVACDNNGNVDLDSLTQRIDEHRDNLAAIMVTYPSTHGVFEEKIDEICDRIHEAGGQVYVDGANLNAMVGLAEPGAFGADVSHLNLHKTFAIPHGGGGPGMGPIGVRAHLAEFLPQHPMQHDITRGDVVSAAPWGSAGILPISWMYIKMLGSEGLTHASSIAVLSANYIAHCLEPHYPILFKGSKNRVAHECIIDLRPLKDASGISEEDIAKRLMDYGFHAPTMSFPVVGTLMIEPTESESLAELDRFCDAMIKIRAEIANVESGDWPKDDNPLINAPHCQADLNDWDRAYSIEQGFFPQDAVKQNKYWPPVNRVDNVFGDRNFCCTLSAYEE